MSFCPKCQKEYPDELSQCPYCEAGNSNSEELQPTQEIGDEFNSAVQPPSEFFGESAELIPGQPDGDKKKPSKAAIIAIIAAVVVVVAAIVIAIFFLSGNKDNNDPNSNDSFEDLTMPSGYEDIISNITDDDGNVITDATDPYGNPISREVDDDGNVTTTFIGPDGEVSTVTTDRDGNIISQNIPGASSNTSSKKDNSSANSSSKNNSSKNNSSNTSSNNNSSNNNSSSNSSNNSSNQGSGGSADGSITINGQKYNPGDTVTYSATGEGISEAVCGIQFKLTYDENVLELDEDSITPLNGSFMVNAQKAGIVYINGISIGSGFNYSMPANLVECKFKVKDSSTKACDINIDVEEVYTGTGSNEIVDVKDDFEVNVTVN